MSIVVLLYRLAMMAVLTFAFVVLLQYGTENFASNAAQEFGALTDFVRSFSTPAAPSPASAPDAAGERH